MTKRLTLVGGVILVLIILVVINMFSQNRYRTQTVDVFSIDPDEVYRIRIEKGTDTLELTLVDTSWQIVGNDSLVVKKRSLDNFFKNVLTIKRQSIVSKNPAKWIKYSVDDSTGTFLTLKDVAGEVLSRVVFGNSKTDWSRNYVRFPGKPEVYQTNANIIYQLQTRETYWGEKPKPKPTPEVPPPDTTTS